MSTKNPLIPSGIELATFRFVAQHLNHCTTAVPKFCTAVPNICQSSAQRFLCHLAVPRILRCSLGFWKTSATLLYNITATPSCHVVLTYANYVAVHCNIYCSTLRFPRLDLDLNTWGIAYQNTEVI